MRVEETVLLRRATRREEEVVERFLNIVKAPPRLYSGGIYVLDAPGGRFRDAFYIPERLRKLLGKGCPAYSAGLYIGMIGGGKLTPGLPLARALAPLCDAGLKCVKLTPRGEELFLYSRVVYGDNVTSWKPGIVLVLSSDGVPLGWGMGEMRRAGDPSRNLILKPIRDLGWYLRRGG